MKRPRSYGEDIDTLSDRSISKDWGRRDVDLDRSASQRKIYPRVDNSRRGSSSSLQYERSIDDDRDPSRTARKRLDHDSEGFDRRKGFDRYCGSRMGPSTSPRSLYGSERVQRTECYSWSRREFPRGFRSDRDRTKRDEGSCPWRRSNCVKDQSDELWHSSERAKFVCFEGGNAVSPPGLRDDVKSPSGDLSCEKSRSVEIKKSFETCEGSGKNSEVEEGEVEPELASENDTEVKLKVEANANGVHGHEGSEPSRAEIDLEMHSEKEMETQNEFSERGASEEHACHEDCKNGTSGMIADAAANMGGTLGDFEYPKLKEEVTPDPIDNETGENLQGIGPSTCWHADDVTTKPGLKKPVSPGEKPNEIQSLELEAQADDVHSQPSNPVTTDEKIKREIDLDFMSIRPDEKENESNNRDLTFSFPVEVSAMGISSYVATDQIEEKVATERQSNASFALCLSSDAPKPASASISAHKKGTNGDLKKQLLDLSLGLPNVSPSLPAHDFPAETPYSSSKGRSFPSLPCASYDNNSDRFTQSISLSGSQSFFHNPSCSLRQNSFENCENSVTSHSVFQGAGNVLQGNWQGQSSNNPMPNEISFCPKMLQNETVAFHVSQASQSIPNGHCGGSGAPNVSWQQCLRRQLSGYAQHEDCSPVHSTGSHDTLPEYKDKRVIAKERNGWSSLIGGCHGDIGKNTSEAASLWRFICQIISEPVHIMARKFQEMPEEYLANLKESAGKILGDASKLHNLQEMLKSRTDLKREILTHGHKAQLEILVAFSTGLPDFLTAGSVPCSDLVDIFLRIKCQNLACRSLLPVDECDCKVCSQRDGFCSACMCLLCSKFDMAFKTCSWVGCDVCGHWCHTDCALHGSYIRNGRSAASAHGATEMQFFCLACEHPSEMFGFVKEVFRECAKDWKSETLCKELEYVRRIFLSSEDSRGKQLYNLVSQMLGKLDNRCNFHEVYNTINTFFSDNNFNLSDPATALVKEHPEVKTSGEANVVIGATKELPWLHSMPLDKTAGTGISNVGASALDRAKVDTKRTDEATEPKIDMEKKPFIDELESIVRIKQAEAQMFQTRADDARREAEGLKRIALAKSEKIESEYSIRIAKLRLTEAEERRRQKLEELQLAKRAHIEYFDMKVRMEADIKDLLLKMEATKRNFGA